ncbi:MAG: hypothetical protein IB616_01315 [Methanosarcinales archaeon]|nr:MAG: hypothetical protein IB616_01315 [Methanosarcinales archaeon]
MKRKGGERGNRKGKLIRVTGKPLDILEDIHESSNGRRSYTDIIGELTKSVEMPGDKLIKTYDELESICKVDFNPGTARLVELFRPIVFQSARGKFDTKFCERKILEIIEQNKVRECDAK